jgi:hypothetical protein
VNHAARRNRANGFNHEFDRRQHAAGTLLNQENCMQTSTSTGITAPAPRSRKWWLMMAAAGICLASWIALAVGLLLGVGFTPRLVLATAAALSTEGLMWITAAVLGVRLFEARRVVWQRVRAAFGG